MSSSNITPNSAANLGFDNGEDEENQRSNFTCTIMEIPDTEPPTFLNCASSDRISVGELERLASSNYDCNFDVDDEDAEFCGDGMSAPVGRASRVDADSSFPDEASILRNSAIGSVIVDTQVPQQNNRSHVIFDQQNFSHVTRSGDRRNRSHVTLDQSNFSNRSSIDQQNCSHVTTSLVQQNRSHATLDQSNFSHVTGIDERECSHANSDQQQNRSNHAVTDIVQQNRSHVTLNQSNLSHMTTAVDGGGGDDDVVSFVSSSSTNRNKPSCSKRANRKRNPFDDDDDGEFSTAGDVELIPGEPMIENGHKTFDVEEPSWKHTWREDMSAVFASNSLNNNFDEVLVEEEVAVGKEHFFIKDIVITSPNNNYNDNNECDTSTWSAVNSEHHDHDLVPDKTDWWNRNDEDAAEISTISYGSYFRAASCPLGSLNGTNSKRPEFGIPVVSPKRKSSSLPKREIIDSKTFNKSRSSLGYTEEYNKNDDRTVLSDGAKSHDRFSLDSHIHQNTTANSSTIAKHLSLRDIRKLIDELSVGANATHLVESILKAKDELAARRKDELAAARRKDELADHRKDDQLAACRKDCGDQKKKKKSANVINDIIIVDNVDTKPFVKNNDKIGENLAAKIDQSATAISATSFNNTSLNRIRLAVNEMSVGGASCTRLLDRLFKTNEELTNRNRPPVRPGGSDPVPPQNAKDRTSSPNEKSFIFTNKLILNFDYVETGRSASQCCSLRSNAAEDSQEEDPLRIKVYVKSHKENFQVMEIDQDGYVLLYPKQTLQLTVVFKPTAEKFYSTRLIFSTTKFSSRCCIPIFGCGALSK